MKYLKIYENFFGTVTFMEWVKREGYSKYSIKIIDCKDKRITDLIGIEKFSDLRKLNCDSNYVKSLEPLKYCTKLEELDISNNNLENLKGLEKLTNLHRLAIDGNGLENLNEIENLTNMDEMWCHANKLTNLKGVENFKILKYICCADNFLKNLDEIEKLPSLKKLNCDHNSWEYPLSMEIVNKFNIEYDYKNKFYFTTYESQKKLMEEHPERMKELEPFGIHEKIREEFADIIEGNEFGFFGLK